MAWGQGVQDSDQPSGMVPALAVSWCTQSSLPLTQEGNAPTCLTLGAQEALRTGASKGPGEVLAGPAVLAGLRLALVNIWGPEGRKAPAQHRDGWWLGTGAWRGSTSPTGHGPFPCHLLPQAQWPGTSLLLDAHCLRPAPEEYGMGTFLQGYLGTTSSVRLCQEIHPIGCHVPSSNFQQPTFSYHCPLPDPREMGWSHLPLSHHLPRCPLSPNRSSISLVENPMVGW